MEQLRLLCEAAVSLLNLQSYHHAGKQRQFSVFDPICIFLLCVCDMKEQQDLHWNR